MAFTLIWSPAARLDLWDILSYINESNPQAAGDFGRGVFAAVEHLTIFPESGILPEEHQNFNIFSSLCSCLIAFL